MSSGTVTVGPAGSRAMGCRLRSRLAQFSEFVEVAHRIGGIEAAIALARSVPAPNSTPPWQRSCARTPSDPRRLGIGAYWDA